MDNFVNVEWQKLNLKRLAVALGVSSLVENLFYHPWWVLKTREQVEVSPTRGGVWRNSFLLAHRIWRKEGIRALYRGFWAGSIGSLPSVYLYLITYHKVKHELSANTSPTLQVSAPFLAGVSAEMVALYFFVPIDVITQRMQLHNTAGKSAICIAKDIFSKEGIRGMYRGTLLTLLKLGIGSGVWWFTYEENKSAMSKLTGKPPTTFIGILAGFLAGIVSTIVTNPLDVVKTRIQVQSEDTSGVPYSKALKGFKEIWQKEGWIGINRGLVPKLISQGPLSAFWAVIYELVLKYSITPS
jgi:solute carrier family 25 iron transporter 28/37